MKIPASGEMFEGMADRLRDAADGFELVRVKFKEYENTETLNLALIRVRVAILLAVQYTETAAAIIEASNEVEGERDGPP